MSTAFLQIVFSAELLRDAPYTFIDASIKRFENMHKTKATNVNIWTDQQHADKNCYVLDIANFSNHDDYLATVVLFSDTELILKLLAYYNKWAHVKITKCQPYPKLKYWLTLSKEDMFQPVHIQIKQTQ